MLERFADGARAVVYLAVQEANELGHSCAGVEHVVLGLLGEQNGVAARVLRSLGVTPERVRLRLSETGPTSVEGPSTQGPFPLPFTPQGTRVLERALREALIYRSRFVRTEHILLSVVGEHEGVAVELLREFDVDAAKIRNAIPAPLRGSRTVVREEPDGPLVVRFPRIRADDRPEGGGESAEVEHGADERAGDQQRVAGSRRLIDGLDSVAAEPCVTRVHATVKLQSPVSGELGAAREDATGERRRVVRLVSSNPESLSLHISLSAQDSSGRRIYTSGRDFGISGPRRGIWHRWHGPPLPVDPELADRIMLFEHRVDLHDIEDAVNQMLGRDPSLHWPPRLSWQNLIDALKQAGVRVTELELIGAPLTVELTPEVQGELERST